MSSVFEEIYEAVKAIPRGKVTTYGHIAKMIGRPRASRVVGYALHANPTPVIIPCHRVVNRHGMLPTAFAFGGIEVQAGLLRDEGVEVSDEHTVDLEIYGWFG